MKCDICREEIEGAPFTIKAIDYTLQNVCGTCMNLYANDEFEALTERLVVYDCLE